MRERAPRGTHSPKTLLVAKSLLAMKNLGEPCLEFGYWARPLPSLSSIEIICSLKSSGLVLTPKAVAFRSESTWREVRGEMGGKGAGDLVKEGRPPSHMSHHGFEYEPRS
jgi:hypothetical protein